MGRTTGYEEFEKTDNFYAGDTAIDGINDFYENIFKYKMEHKEDKEFRKKTHILMVDEYAGILQDMSSSQANELKNRISRMVKMREKFKVLCMGWGTDCIQRVIFK